MKEILFALILILLLIYLLKINKYENYSNKINNDNKCMISNKNVHNSYHKNNDIYQYFNYADTQPLQIDYPEEKYIKDIFDDLTNDHRLDFQQNLDNLDGMNKRVDYFIGENYGYSNFDTYHSI